MPGRARTVDAWAERRAQPRSTPGPRSTWRGESEAPPAHEARQQDDEVAAGQELPDTIGDRPGPGRRLVELDVEVVQEPSDDLRVRRVGPANGQIRTAWRFVVAMREQPANRDVRR